MPFPGSVRPRKPLREAARFDKRRGAQSPMDEIDELRQRIDSIDDELLRLFNERARLAVQIGQIKKTQGLPIYIPSREAQVLGRVQRDNPGPLSPEAVARLYQQLMEEAKRLEDADVGSRARSDAPNPTL